MTFDVGSESPGSVVATRSVFLQAFHHNPIEIAAKKANQARSFDLAPCGEDRELLGREGAEARGGPSRLFLAYDAQHFIEARLKEFAKIEWGPTGEQFIKKNTEAINV